MRTAAILVAGGTGSRFGGDLPKQYLPLGESTVLKTCINRFVGHSGIDDLVVVIAEGAEQLYEKSVPAPRPRTVHGGSSRAESVLAGLRALENNAPDYVLIHDAARPYVTAEQIDAVLAALDEHEGCAPALSIVDAIKQVESETGKVLADADRNTYLRLQTPQGFHFTKLLRANMQSQSLEAAHDDISIALSAGMNCITIKGDPANIKITTRDDMLENTTTVTGFGYDVHRICEGDYLFLCGVKINAEFSLAGHSDADVALHAVTDAVLGALAEGDIGDHFPPSDPQWKGAASDRFLEHAIKLAKVHHACIRHVDLTIVCERPKIKPHRQAMREHLAGLMGLPIRRISVKASTTEGLGFTGRGEGIAAQAVISMELPA